MPASAPLRLAGTIGITVTGIVHFTLLRPLLDLDGADYVADKLLHMVVPVLAIVGWALFGPRPRVERSAQIWSVAWPLAYLGYVLVVGAASGWYPYPFLDVDEKGWGHVLGASVGITVLFLLLIAAATAHRPARQAGAGGVGSLPRRYRAAMTTDPAQTGAGIDPTVPPSGTGCAECDPVGGWWVHLRRCAQCGHVGCCDSSPAQHATAHFRATGHPVIQSFEPGEDWFWDYRTERAARRPGARGRRPAHPADQTVPGPADRVPGRLARRTSTSPEFSPALGHLADAVRTTTRAEAPLTSGRNGWVWPMSTPAMTGTSSLAERVLDRLVLGQSCPCPARGCGRSARRSRGRTSRHAAARGAPGDVVGAVLADLEVDQQPLVGVRAAVRRHVGVRRPGQRGHALEAAADQHAGDLGVAAAEHRPLVGRSRVMAATPGSRA